MNATYLFALLESIEPKQLESIEPKEPKSIAKSIDLKHVSNVIKDAERYVKDRNRARKAQDKRLRALGIAI